MDATTWLHIVEFVILGLLAWIARTTQATSVKVAVIAQQIADSDLASEDQKVRIQAIEARLNAAEIEQVETRLRIQQLNEKLDAVLRK